MVSDLARVMPQETEHAPLDPVTIETVDQSVHDWFDKTVSAHVKFPNGERKKVPVTMAAGERAVTSRQRRGIRDKNGVLILPLISIRRTGVDPRPEMQALGTETPTIQLSRRVDGKTNVLQNNVSVRSSALRPAIAAAVYEVLTIPFPDRNVFNYELVIQAQYVTQMNSIIEKIFHELDIQKTFVAPFENDGRHPKIGEQFEKRARISRGYVVGFFDESLSDRGNFEEFTDQERIVMYSTQFKVPATLQLDPEGERPSLQREYTAFGLNFGDERVSFVDDPDELEKIFGGRR